MGDRGVTHGVKYQARALTACAGSTQQSRWLVGTNALREENVVGQQVMTSCLLKAQEHRLSA